MWSFAILVMLVMILLNSFFAAYEIALASISLSRLHVLEREARKGAAAALYMKENMEGSLAVVQLGITLVGVIAAATGGAGAEENIAPWLQGEIQISPAMADVLAITLVAIPLTVLTIVFGELTPKVFALRNREWVCLHMSPAMQWFAIIVWPVVWVLENSVMLLMKWGERHWKARLDVRAESAELQELRASVALARTSRLIGTQEEKIILAAASIPRHPVGDIMLPAEHINMLHSNASLADSLVIAHLDMHSRFPIAERAGDPQSIVGYVNVKDIVASMRLTPQGPSLQSIIRPIPSFSQETPVAQCLERLIRDHNHIALIRCKDGRVLGMVTLEDMIEELVGEIEDEYDRLPAHAVASGKGWVVGGGISLDRLKELTGLDLKVEVPQSGGTHLNDWITDHLGRSVQMGEVIVRGDLRIVVRKIRRQKVQEAQIQRIST